MRRLTWSLTTLATIITSTLSALPASAVTYTLNRDFFTDQTNRPFFSQAAFPTFANDYGYVGTATPGVSSSTTITRLNTGNGGNSTPTNTGNGFPMGTAFDFTSSFTVDTVNPAHRLTDAGNAGIGVDSSATVADGNTARFSAGEKLHFGAIQVSNISLRDPLGLIVPGSLSITSPKWRSLRSNTNQVNSSPNATVSSDAAGTQDVFNFAPSGGQGVILNDTPGVFPALTEAYVTTNAGNWPLKGVGYQLDVTYELAPVPASRRTYYFGDPNGTFDGLTSYQFLDNDTTLTLGAAGSGAVLDANDLGVGVNSTADDIFNGQPLNNSNQRFIDGTLGTPESVQLSFDQDVYLESLTIGSLDVSGGEAVVLGFVSGTNPFTGLSGYSGEYTLGANSLTFLTSDNGLTPYVIPFGKNGQGQILIEAGTVLSVTSNPSHENGFLLDMLTVNLAETSAPDADFNDDGAIDDLDLGIWQTNYGLPSVTTLTGDADGDGDADGRDFLTWQRTYTGPLALAAVSVPEPNSICLLAAIGTVMASMRRTPFKRSLA